MKEKVLQKIADFIILKITNSETQEEIDFFHNIGLLLDSYAVSEGIYLI